MKCEHDLERLILFQAGELRESEAEQVRHQVASCTGCREELDGIAFLSAAPLTPELDEAAVAAARAMAYARIGSSWRHRSRVLVHRLSSLARSLRPLPELALGMALIAFGYVLGGSEGEGAPTDLPGSAIVDVHGIEFDEATGQAIVRYDPPHSRALTGNLGDAAVASVLQAALMNGDDNGIRMHALKTVRALASSGTPESDLSDAIVGLVRTEQQEGLRLRAIWALDALYASSTLPDAARESLLYVLTSEAGDGVRIAALNTLMAHEPSLQDAVALRQVVSSDTNPYVRSGAAATLERIGVPLERLN
jgi:hypothetical protein